MLEEMPQKDERGLWVLELTVGFKQYLYVEGVRKITV
jgi:hypothetical protein